MIADLFAVPFALPTKARFSRTGKRQRAGEQGQNRQIEGEEKNENIFAILNEQVGHLRVIVRVVSQTGVDLLATPFHPGQEPAFEPVIEPHEVSRLKRAIDT